MKDCDVENDLNNLTDVLNRMAVAGWEIPGRLCLSIDLDDYQIHFDGRKARWHSTPGPCAPIGKHHHDDLPIETLKSHGASERTVQKLQQAGIYRIADLRRNKRKLGRFGLGGIMKRAGIGWAING